MIITQVWIKGLDLKINIIEWNVSYLSNYRIIIINCIKWQILYMIQYLEMVHEKWFIEA